MRAEKTCAQGELKLNQSMTEELKPKTLLYLKSATMPVGVGDVAKHLNVSWSTARQVLMELLIESKVECERTTHARIFRLPKDGGPSS
jgi:Mn-dependent DtxR family transcriptional regulator